MIKNLFPLFVFSLLFVQLGAQTAQNISINGNLGRQSAGPRMCNEAGTFTFDFDNFVGQSNDINQQTIFLCLGDALPIIHDGNFDLTGDPQTSTAAGIGYAFYDCEPTTGGPDLTTILTDPCLNHTSPLIINGTPIPQTNNIWIAVENINGNLTLMNDGGLQSSFNGGVPAPIQFWFAPITIDNFAALGYESDAGGASGPCVDVNTDEAFSVVYLNEITATDINVTAGASGCVGSFRVRGGLPEWIIQQAYDIDITLDTDPSVRGSFNITPNHDDVITFSVPQDGIYNVTIEDGKSCGTTFTMDMSACQTVTFNMPLENVVPGSNECLDITVANFVNVGSMQFTITWDAEILDFTQVANFNPAMPNLDASNFFEVNPGVDGVLTFSWNDLSFNNVTINDGEVLFQLCFDVIGALGDCSPVTISNSPTPIEIGDSGTPQGDPPIPYGVVINDGKVIVSNEVLFVLLEQDSVTCPNDSDGAFTLTMADGTAPYRFSWNTVPPVGPDNGAFVIGQDGGSFTVNDLDAGTYQVTVEDSSNPMNIVVDTVSVLSGPTLGVNLEPTSPLCFGQMNGTVRAVVLIDGVVQPNHDNFTFTWNSTPQDTSALVNVASGFYAVTVTDASGCTAEASTTLSQPAQLTVLGNNTFVADASCSGSMDGSITITASGGTTSTGNYFFQWDNGLGSLVASSSQVNNLNPGTYCVTVVDDNGCEFMDCYQVGAQKVLSVVPVVTDVSCNNLCDGQIFITGSTTGAAADLPYTFTWNTVNTPPSNTNTTSTISGLCAGTYILTLTDSDPAGCMIIDTFEVVQPDSLQIALIERVNETCVVGNDGSATLGITGGTFPYAYSWSHDVTLTDSIATGLSQGTYTIDVTDANNCTESLDIDILAPTPPMVDMLDDDFVSCPGDMDGSLTVVATPGGAPIAGYQWDNGLSGSTINNLSPGIYIVTISAEDGCETIDTAAVISPDPLMLDSINMELPNCPGDGNGIIAVFVSGGTTPFTYTWSTDPNNPISNNLLPGLMAGSYLVTVNDANNCEPLVVSIELPDPPSIVVTVSDTTNVSCPDDTTCDGGAMASAMYSDGTTGLFNFMWSSNDPDELGVAVSSASQLCRGVQTVTVGDGECGEIVEFTIGSPEEIMVAVDQEKPSCNGFSDGSITLMPSGGTGTFTYQWVGFPETSNILSDLPMGNYTAILTDANGCTKEQLTALSEPDELILTLDPVRSTSTVSCNGDMDGIFAVVYNSNAAINPVGANPFTWSMNIAPATSDIATNLAAGTYSVTITDTKGCQDSLSYSIGEPAPLVFSVEQPESPLCFGEQTLIFLDTVFGGTGTMLSDYNFIIDNNGLTFPADQGAPVFGGDHIVTVVDVSGCTEETDVFIDEPGPILVNLPVEIEVELGDTLTRLMPTVSGGTQPFLSYLWTPADFLSSDTTLSPFVIPRDNLEYTLLVTDQNGCTGEASIYVALDANRNVYIPNVFSPNGDGPNDEFRVFACRGVESINFARIYDRWGGVVYESDEVSVSCEGGTPLWDGRKNGKVMNPGVYVYIIEVTFLDNVTLLYRGDITLLR
ncbi:MAG: hypothetical protein DHS20C18_13740 [Saprospiraceae bacterium]|nr:MAG: hypothetical protein DHS20C18_13740 [Saprospiraceae bacterium]